MTQTPIPWEGFIKNKVWVGPRRMGRINERRREGKIFSRRRMSEWGYRISNNKTASLCWWKGRRKKKKHLRHGLSRANWKLTEEQWEIRWEITMQKSQLALYDHRCCTQKTLCSEVHRSLHEGRTNPTRRDQQDEVGSLPLSPYLKQDDLSIAVLKRAICTITRWLQLSHSLVSVYSDVLGENIFIHFAHFLIFFPLFSGLSLWFTYFDIKTFLFLMKCCPYGVHLIETLTFFQTAPTHWKLY